MWGGGIAPTDMRSNSHLMSARGSLLHFTTTQTTTTVSMLDRLQENMVRGIRPNFAVVLTRTKVLFSI